MNSSRVGRLMSNPIAYFRGRARAHLYVVIVLYSLLYVSLYKNMESIIIGMFSLDSLHLVCFKNCMNLFHTPYYYINCWELMYSTEYLLNSSFLFLEPYGFSYSIHA